MGQPSAIGASERLKHYARWAILWIGLASMILLPRVTSLELFVGPDELIELGRDNQFAAAVAAGDWSGTLVGDGKPSVTVMWLNTLGVGVKWLWSQASESHVSFVEALAPSRPIEVWSERRLALAVASGVLVLAAWPLLRVIWDGHVATVAVAVMAIEPFLLAYTRMIRGDSLVAGFMLLSLLGALAFLKTGRSRYNCLAGVMAALAMLTKFTGGLVAGVVLLLYAAVALRQHRGRWRDGVRWFLMATAGWALPAAVVFFGLWPAWWFRPLETFNLVWSKVVYHASEATIAKDNFHFWGALHASGLGPGFYPALAALRMSPWLLVGSLTGVGVVVWQVVRCAGRISPPVTPAAGQVSPAYRPPQHAMPATVGEARQAAMESRPTSAAAPYALAVLFYVGAYWLSISVVKDKIDRYFLPVVPGLTILAAIAWTTAARWVQNRLPRRLVSSPALLSIPAGLALLAVGHVATYHPLYSTYYDPLVASPASVQWALPVGQGEGVDTALKHLSAQPGAADSIVLCGTNFPRCQPFFPGEIWHQEDLRTSRWFQANYVLWHIDEQQLGVFPAGVLAYLRRQTPTYVATYHGIDYTWLYPVPHAAYRTGGSKLEGVATLLGYDVTGTPLDGLSPGRILTLHLYWENEGQAADKQFYWRVVDEHGYHWSQSDAHPLPSFTAQADQTGAIIEGETTLALPPDMPPGDYRLQAGFADERGDVGQFVLPEPGSRLTVQGISTAESTPGHLLDTPLAPNLLLRGYDLAGVDDGAVVSSYAPLPGEDMWVTLYWQATGHIQRDYTMTMHLLNAQGKEMASWSSRPVYGSFPTNVWPADAHVRDPWLITVPDEAAPGDYRLLLSLREAGEATERVRVALGNVGIVARRVSYEAPPMQFQSDVSFGDVAVLLGYNLAGDLLPDGAEVRVELVWQASQPTDRPYTVTVRLADASGVTLAEHRAEPDAGQVSTTAWQPGEVVVDQHTVTVTPRPSGAVNLEVRMLDAAAISLPLSNGTDVLIIPDIGGKVQWVSPAQ